MESISFEHLRSFFDRVKNAGLFERLFFWKRITASGFEAYAEYQRLQDLLQEQDGEISEITAKNQTLSLNLEHQGQQLIQLQQDLVALKAKNEDLNQKMNERENVAGGLIEADRKNRDAIAQLKADLAAWTAKYDQLNVQFIEAQKSLTGFQQKEDERIREHDRRVTELSSLRQQLESDRLRLEQEREEEIRRGYAAKEETWKQHEQLVEESLKNICRTHNIEYCDKEKFPYAGKPDNSLVICDQYIIFDAKSPKNSNELGNFPQYIKTQAEAVKKYIKAEDVKKDIFLVVPANTVEYLEDFHYDMADWQVYIVTQDCLEPVILALKKVEDYEFAGQLSPEDRENLCRVIGKFAHATKRRIQIDNYFCNEFINLLQSCDHLLPEEIKQKVIDYEMAEKMNPPIEKRKKKIPIRELEHDVKVIGKEAEAREIDVTAVTKEKIRMIPLDKFL